MKIEFTNCGLNFKKSWKKREYDNSKTLAGKAINQDGSLADYSYYNLHLVNVEDLVGRKIRLVGSYNPNGAQQWALWMFCANDDGTSIVGVSNTYISNSSPFTSSLDGDDVCEITVPVGAKYIVTNAYNRADRDYLDVYVM